MSQKLQQQLKEVGSKLETPPTNKDALIKLLKQASAALCEMDQSPSKAVLESMKPFLSAIVNPDLLKHQDKEIKLLVATCLCEITRVTAPEAPYSDDVLKDVFFLIVSTFSGLRDTKGPSFGRRVIILETLAKYRSCVVMLDLECDELVNEMFSTLFAVASDEHSESVLASMQTIMEVLVEESEDVREDLLLIILSVLGRSKKDITMAARKLAMNVIGHCAGKLEPVIKQFLISLMSGDSSPLNSQIDYHEIIYDLYCCAPQVLSGVVPYLTGELLADKMEVRLKAVRLVGELFALPGSSTSEIFQPVFSEFLKRLTDRVVEVRMSVLEHVKLCLLSDPCRAEAPQIIAALCDRLLDFDESIRKQVVAVICDVACRALSSISVETVKLVGERLRDKSLLVKTYTMERLSEIYRASCSERFAELTKHDEYDWIPGKIIRCFYDKDFRSDIVENIICKSLFPADFSVKDKTKKWVRLFSAFDKVELKALEKILEQKQRLQQEMLKYFSLRQMYQDNDAPELQKKVMLCFRIMSRCFIDPIKAEENFQILDQIKDANVWKILKVLLDPNTSSLQSCNSRDDLLKIFGEKHRLLGFMSTLSLKCSYILFNKDYVKDFLLEADLQKSAGNRQLTQSCMNILVILASFSPLLLSGIEEDLVHLLEDDNEVIKEGVLHVLAKAGGAIREQLGVSSSSLDLLLERICLEGSRRQAKYAVHALAAITKDDGLKSLSVLYKRLVDMLEDKTHLPAVLQSLGCIAQTAMPVFETRESEIEVFIKKNILECSPKTEDKVKESWDDKSELCSLKIFGIKTLVKSYLPVKDAHLRPAVDELIRILQNILSFGEISKDIQSSSVDKAHLRLAAAKAILRLSKHWDHKIPIDVFYLTLRTSDVGFPEVKKLFLSKVHQYIKDRLLDPKYACAFLLDIQSPQSDTEEDKHNFSDIIQMCQQGKARQLSVQSDANSSVVYPECILPYFVHALAHHFSCPDIDECKDVKAYEPLYRKLHLFLSMLAHGDEDGKSEVSLKKEEVTSIVSILRSIKRSDDSVDKKISKKSYALCDLGLSITKRLAQKPDDFEGVFAPISLPSVLYKPHEKKQEAESEVAEGQTWLADESVLAHFESIKLEANGSVPPDIIEDEIFRDSEADGFEVPLGTVMKRLKAKGAKAKKEAKDGSLSAANKIENNVDILDMVREINLDNLGVSSKFDSSNGHEHVPRKIRSDQKHKGKRMSNDSTEASVPKRQRSSSTKGLNRLSFPRSGLKDSRHPTTDNMPREGLSSFDTIEMDEEPHAGPEERISLQEGNKESVESDLFVSRSGDEGRNSNRVHVQMEEHVETDNDEKSKKVRETAGVPVTNTPKSASSKKRKRRSVAGLAKCTSKQGESRTADLIDCRIKVWWPMDKKFYEGLVKAYDHQKKKHVILYDDGDIEVLRLDKERWELVEDAHKPTKRLSLSKSPHSKGRSFEKKSKSLGGSKQTKELIDISPSSKGKRTPRKNLNKGQKGASRTFGYPKVEDREKSEESDREFVTFSKVENLDSEDDMSEREGGSLAAGEESDKEVKLVPKGKQLEEAETKSSDTEYSKEEEPGSGQKEEKMADSSHYDAPESDNEEEEEEEEEEKEEGKEEEEEEEEEEKEGKEEEEEKGEGKEEEEEKEGKEEEEEKGEGKEEEEDRSHLEEKESPNSSRDNSALVVDKVEEKSDSQGDEADEADSSPMADEKSSASEAENSDDEPLSVWKSRVGKSVEGK